MNQIYLELIYSQRVRPATRKALLRRLETQADYHPKAISPALYAVLQAVLGRLIPQEDRAEPVDIARCLDEVHFLGEGNGWRYADMPSDKEAFELGLKLLERDARRRYDAGFAELSTDRQDLMLGEAQNAKIGWQELNSRRWFEELLTDATSLFVANPETLAEMGFSGIAFLPGWAKIGLDEGETWEPHACE